MNSALSKLRRRDFLKMAAVGGLALSVPFVASRLKSSISNVNQDAPFTTSFNAMGTTISIIIEDAISTGYANLVVASLSNEITNFEKVLTRFPGGKDLWNLNATGDIENASASLVAVLESAKSYSEASGGSFDITVKPVLDLLQGYLQGQPFPSDSQFESAKSLIDYQQVSISNQEVSFGKTGMGITLDGIATGYILDKSVATLKSKGIKSALINFGGTLATIGTRIDGSPWKVGIVDPIEPTDTLGYLYLKDQTVATSGDYENYYTSNKDYYHIIDPQTARSPLFSHSATVVAPNGMIADPLGVALMVEDTNDATKLADSFPAEYLLYTRRNGVATSSGMKALMTG